MKKVILVLIVYLLVGCSISKETELNHDEIMRGDLSSIEGEYVNSEGDVIILDAEEMKKRMLSDVTFTDDGSYFMNVLTDDGMYGIGFAIYPIGVEGLVWKVNSNDILLKTDTSKIRIRYYQA